MRLNLASLILTSTTLLNLPLSLPFSFTSANMARLRPSSLPLRVSPRRSGLSTSTTPTSTSSERSSERSSKRLKKSTTPASPKPSKTLNKRTASPSPSSTTTTNPTLKRTRELSLLTSSSLEYIIGVDEAGRGPIAGPVVAGAITFPEDHDRITGITDSKAITSEDERERLYVEIMNACVSDERIKWAVGVVNNKRIDEINILQGTCEAMRMCVRLIVRGELWSNDDNKPMSESMEADIKREGCYVIGNCKRSPTSTTHSTNNDKDPSFYALIDGNRIPAFRSTDPPGTITGFRLSRDLPCAAEAIVKGDNKEYCIAAASILAKVTRDRLMHQYSSLYPAYNLAQHKGYPTKSHMDAVRKFGASSIHRRTFAPLKNMTEEQLKVGSGNGKC